MNPPSARPRESQCLGFDPAGRLALRRAPTCSSSEIAVAAVRFAGVCGTDLAMIRGSRPERPAILGHEAVGDIVESRLPHLPAGSRIVFNPVLEDDQFVILGHSTDGIWCGARPIRAEETPHLVPVEIPNVPCSSLVEPLSTAIYACDLAEAFRPLERAAIFGTGPVAFLILKELRARGVPEILLIGRNAERLHWAREIGPAASPGVQATTSIDDAAAPASVDAAFICLTHPASAEMIPAAAALLRDGGVLDLVGGIMDGDFSPALATVGDLNAIRRANVCGRPREGRFAEVSSGGRTVRVTGHRGSSKRHIRRAASRIASDLDGFSQLVTHVVTPDQALELLPGYAHGRTKRLDGRHIVKIVIDFQAET